MDRTVATGTGYIGQYPPELAKIYEDLDTCPDDLLLFMHHVPYTHVLHDGKTVVQYVYDAHYEGAATAQTYAPRWRALNGLIDDERYEQTLKLFTYQAGHAIVWRDAVTKWFQKESGISDTLGRVGNYPDRIEAENMTPKATLPSTLSPGRPPPTVRLSSASSPPAASLPLRSTSLPAPTTSPFSTSTSGPANLTSLSNSTTNPSANGSPTTFSHRYVPKTNLTATPAPALRYPTSR